MLKFSMTIIFQILLGDYREPIDCRYVQNSPKCSQNDVYSDSDDGTYTVPQGILTLFFFMIMCL